VWHADDPVFVGRDAELARIRVCAEDAAAGRAWVVWIEGEAGAGKTALLDRALEMLPAEFAVLRAEADELAVDVPFWVTGQLADLGAVAPFAAGLELVDRWATEQHVRPVAVVVEDLHWADARSSEALVTAARRLGRDRVVMIVTSRSDGGTDGWERVRLDPRRCRRIEVGPLTVEEVAALAAGSGVELPRRAAERLHRHTGGHALHARTLLAELDPVQLTGGDGDLPAPRSLASTTIARLAQLPSPARDLALALAVVGRAAPLPLVGAIAGVADPTTALESLLTTGFVSWRPGTDAELRFTHPLYRAALVADLSPTRSRALHRAAAGVLGGREALAHRVAAADGADAALAADLTAEAEREVDRGSRRQAARYLLWASSVEPVRQQAERCLLDGVRLLLDDGQLVRAGELRRLVEACADSPRRDLVLGTLEAEAGHGKAAGARLRRAADDGPRDVAGASLAKLGHLYVALGRGREAVEVATRLLALPDVPPEEEQGAWVDAALGTMFVAGAPAGLAHLVQRLPQPPDEVPAADVDLLVARGTLGFYAGRATAAIVDLQTGVRLARRVGAATPLPRAHLQLAHLLVGAGAWDEALVHARLALSLVSEERRVWIQAQTHAVMGRLHACRGGWAQAEEHVAAAESAAAALATAEAVFTACIARATLARARGQPHGVVAAFEPLLGGGERPLPMATSLGWWPMIIFATGDGGDLDSARVQVDRLRAAARERGLDLDAQLLGLEALLALGCGNTRGAAEGFARAVELAGPDVQVLDRAELHHRFGRLLLGLGRRRDGVAQLHRARELLAGADPFLCRVEADLASAGMRAPRRGPRSPLELTDRERDVVALVVAGMTNREAAAELYVSDKAVEYHLGNVYAKLGIRSRRELRARMRDPQPAAATQD